MHFHQMNDGRRVMPSAMEIDAYELDDIDAASNERTQDAVAFLLTSPKKSRVLELVPEDSGVFDRNDFRLPHWPLEDDLAQSA